ncbi:NUDIX hydrolase [Agrobacterium tumefaciens]|jgi:8-oxo-dGTP pyrophosphatase MutT (NUDIX family)|uniref:NUDIX hydrolase n=1 Tax=Agrobacterium tumefaciens TaxID=358 RepID=UPI000DD55BE8|nr:NUDIX hydrolase [Agrobacterium tumefaciens]UXT98804.1 NUDIX hydrolase [Agrobacterium tumefaciens]WQE43055.1 NUDIX hydrolase [Agrobacterium tumefaciens]
MKSSKKRRKTRPARPLTLLQQLAAVPEKLFTGAFRQQYAALCFRYAANGVDVEILLVTSRTSQRWIIPRGWPMKRKKPHQAAAIEAWEEAGVRGRVKKDAVGRYTYLKMLDNGDVVPCMVDVFQIEVTETDATFKEHGERLLEWVRPDEAARRVRDIELKSLLVDFRPKGKKKRRSAETP